MPIQFNPTDIENFFGVPLQEMLLTEPSSLKYWILYEGSVLKYSIILDVENDVVMISGDERSPWSSDSMYEFNIPCTSILTGPSGYSSGYEPEDVALKFYYGDASDWQNRTLTIRKRSNQDLIVWPYWPYPQGHPFASDNDNKQVKS
jgi:hypothetical protein